MVSFYPCVVNLYGTYHSYLRLHSIMVKRPHKQIQRIVKSIERLRQQYFGWKRKEWLIRKGYLQCRFTNGPKHSARNCYYDCRWDLQTISSLFGQTRKPPRLVVIWKLIDNHELQFHVLELLFFLLYSCILGTKHFKTSPVYVHFHGNQTTR